MSAAALDRILQLLADGRPRVYEDVAGALGLTEDELAGVLEATDRVVWTPEGLVDLLLAFEGRVLTQRLSAEAAAAEALELDNDLYGLLFAWGEEIPLASGGTATVVAQGTTGDDLPPELLTGPEGWLGGAGAGDLVALRLVEGRIALERVAEPAAGAGERDAVLHAVAHCFDDDGHALLGSVLATAAAHDAAVFRDPVAPLGELLDGSGLAGEYGWLWPADHDHGHHHHDHDDDDGRRQILEDVYGFSHCCHHAFDVAEEAFLTAGDPAGDADVALALSHGTVAAALADELGIGAEGPNAPDAEGIVALASRFAEAADGEAVAGPLFIRAAAREALGQVLDAERDLQAVLAAHPEHLPALEVAAGYAEDRGDASLAAALARRAGFGEDAPALARLAPFLKPAAGRNDPCPCGSGRKHKVCCLPTGRHPLPVRAGWLLEKARSYAREAAGPRARLVAVAERSAGAGGDDGLLEALSDPVVQDVALFEEGVLAAYVAVRGVLLPDDERALAEEWTGARRDVFEVVAWPDGGGAIVLRGPAGEIAARAPAGAVPASPGALVLARPLRDGAGGWLVPWAVPVPPTAEGLVRDLLAGAADAGEWVDMVRSLRA